MKIGWCLSWTLAALLLTGSADATDPDAQRRGEALLKEGLAATKRGDFDRARAAFLRASTLIPRGAVWRNLALAEMKLGHPVEALKHYRLAASSSDLDADKRSALQENIRDAYAATGHIEVLANPGAAVTVDGLPVEDAAREPADVMPGKHVVEASTGSGAAKKARAEVDAVPNKMVTADVRLVEEPLAPTPTARVASTAPVALERPSQHDVVLPAEMGAPFWNARRSLGAAIGGIGVVSLGVAAFFFAQVETDKSTASTLTSGASPSACAGSSASSRCAALENAYSSQRKDANLALVFLGAGSAALVTGAALVLWPEPASSRARVGPLIVPHGAGLQLRGDL